MGTACVHLICPIHLCLIFEKSSLKNSVRGTGFLACKNQFRNWFFQATHAVKIQFVELDLSKIKYRWIGRLSHLKTICCFLKKGNLWKLVAAIIELENDNANFDTILASLQSLAHELERDFEPTPLKPNYAKSTNNTRSKK